jgi:hypothetical protein
MAGCGIVLVLIGAFTGIIAIVAGVRLLVAAGVGIGADRRRA